MLTMPYFITNMEFDLMARKPKEEQAEEWSRGAYTVTKPNDKYVIRCGGNVVYAASSKEDVEKYLDLIDKRA